jgi:hypothetical protein
LIFCIDFRNQRLPKFGEENTTQNTTKQNKTTGGNASSDLREDGTGTGAGKSHTAAEEGATDDIAVVGAEPV